jgi:hypothetical protein
VHVWGSHASRGSIHGFGMVSRRCGALRGVAHEMCERNVTTKPQDWKITFVAGAA